MGFDRRIGDAPVLPTVFSPLSLARKLSGDRLREDLRAHPDRLDAHAHVLLFSALSDAFPCEPATSSK